jgi:hypothetical protein
MTDDTNILERIREVVDEEHQLRNAEPARHDDETRQRLRHLEEELDQCWDLLRRRRALREFGQNPDQAHARSVSQVENYLE